MSDRLKIFVSSYACEPYKGSEIGVGWHWVLEMSKYFELWVLTRANNQEPIDKYFADHPEENYGIHWIYYDCPDYIKRFKHQMTGVRTYYTLWQYGANKLIKDVMETNGIEIFHLLTYGNAIWHVSDYGLKKCFIWGPIGGVDTIPSEFSCHYSIKHRLFEAVRRYVVWWVGRSPAFHKRCKQADLILCKANSTLEIIPEIYKSKAKLFTDVAMEKSNHKNGYARSMDSDNLIFITVGRLDGWRGFDLLIEAFEVALSENPAMELRIIGDGSERKHLKQMICDKNLNENVKLIGQISMDAYKMEMQNCDVVLNACLKEGGVTNAFDCMTWAKPLICIDTGGYTRNFDDSCAIILPRKSRAEIIQSLINAMRKIQNAALREKMSLAMVEKGNQITWEIKGWTIRDEIMHAWERCKEKNESIS